MQTRLHLPTRQTFWGAVLIGGALLAQLVSAPMVRAQEETPSQETPAEEILPIEISSAVLELVGQLGGNQFTAREQAGELLFERGAAILPELRAARLTLESDDHERSMRLDRLIDVMAHNDREARIETFLKDPNADLKNWSEMRKWFGDQPRVREMFAELYRDHPAMVEALGGSERQLQDAMEGVKRRLFVEKGVGQSVAATRVDLLAMLIPLVDPNFGRLGDEDFYVAKMLNVYTANNFRKDRILGDSFVRLVARWMERSGPQNRELVLRLTMEWNMEIGKKLALESLSKNPSPPLLARCLQTISRQGTRQDMLRIAKYLDDNRLVFRRDYMSQFQNHVLISDVAAATIAYLAEVPVTEVGFLQPAEHPTFGIVYEQLLLPRPIPKPSETSDEAESEADGPETDEQVEPLEAQPEIPKPPPEDAPEDALEARLERASKAREALKAQLEAQRIQLQRLRAQQLKQLQQRQAFNDPEAQLLQFADVRASIKAAVKKLLPKPERTVPEES